MAINTDQVAQGDVLLRRVAAADTSALSEVPKDEHGRVVLALGEATGHAHVFRDPGVCLLVNETSRSRILVVGNDAELLHDEGTTDYVYTRDHAPIPVQRGTYEVIQQREWVGQGAQNAQD